MTAETQVSYKQNEKNAKATEMN